MLLHSRRYVLLRSNVYIFLWKDNNNILGTLDTMFYYLLYNSSFTFIIDNRLFSTILYGSILYILTHATLNYCSIEILTIINNYFWIIFVLDIISLVYGIYLAYNNQSQDNTHGDLSVSFNLLKNKINTLLDRKNDLTITHINPTINPTINPAINSSPNSGIVLQNQNAKQNSNQTTNKLSTPISQLQKQQSMQHNDINTIENISNTGTTSTPISIIRTRLNDTGIEPIINEDVGYAESVAGSDIGSVMDLDDFEKSL